MSISNDNLERNSLRILKIPESYTSTHVKDFSEFIIYRYRILNIPEDVLQLIDAPELRSCNNAPCSAEAMDWGLFIGGILLHCSMTRLWFFILKNRAKIWLDLVLEYTSMEDSLCKGIGLWNTGFTLGSCATGAAVLVSGQVSVGLSLSTDVGLSNGSTIGACNPGAVVIVVKLMFVLHNFPLSGAHKLLEEGSAFVQRGSSLGFGARDCLRLGDRGFIIAPFGKLADSF